LRAGAAFTRFGLAVAGNVPVVRGISLGGIYVIVGVVVAAIEDYFENIDSFKEVLEAVIAVLIWPLILFGVDINIR